MLSRTVDNRFRNSLEDFLLKVVPQRPNSGVRAFCPKLWKDYNK